MSQTTAKTHTLEENTGRKVRADGEEGKQKLAVSDNTELLESIDAKLGRIIELMEANL